jgi:hypothetical protein
VDWISNIFSNYVKGHRVAKNLAEELSKVEYENSKPSSLFLTGNDFFKSNASVGLSTKTLTFCLFLFALFTKITITTIKIIKKIIASKIYKILVFVELLFDDMLFEELLPLDFPVFLEKKEFPLELLFSAISMILNRFLFYFKTCL